MKSKAIEIDPEKVSGTPVFAGTRVPIRNLFDYIEGGSSLDEFLEDFPTVKKTQVLAAIQFGHQALATSARSA